MKKRRSRASPKPLGFSPAGHSAERLSDIPPSGEKEIFLDDDGWKHTYLDGHTARGPFATRPEAVADADAIAEAQWEVDRIVHLERHPFVEDRPEIELAEWLSWRTAGPGQRAEQVASLGSGVSSWWARLRTYL